MGAVSDLGRFSKLAVALAPWLDRVVIVGGWAHRLHRLHPSERRRARKQRVSGKTRGGDGSQD